MNKTQQIATAFVAGLMLATIALVPAKSRLSVAHAHSMPVAPAGGEVRVTPELPQDEVRDMTYQ